MTSVSTVTPRGVVLRRWYFLAAIVAGGLVGGVLVLKLALPRQPTPTPLPVVAQPQPSIMTASPLIGAARVDGESLRIAAAVKDGLDLASYVDLAGMSLRDVGQRLQAGVSEQVLGVNSVEMTFTASAVDRLGHVRQVPFMTVTAPMSDLKAAEYSTLQWPGVLDLASSVRVAREGRPAVAAWCAKPDRVAPAFCAKALD